MSDKNIPVWDLSILYKSLNDPKIEKDILELNKVATQLVKYKKVFTDFSKNKLKKEIFKKDLIKIVQLYEKNLEISFDLYFFFNLQYDIDSSNVKVSSKLNQIKKVIIDVESKTSFFLIELSKLPKDIISFVNKSDKYKFYKHFINFQNSYKGHFLEEEQEEILVLSSLTGQMAWEQFFSEIVTNLDFGKIKINKKDVQVTDSDLVTQMMSYSAEDREQAYKRQKSTYGKQGKYISYTYNTLVADYQQKMKLKKYSSGLEARCLKEEVKEKSVLKMLDFLDNNTSIFKNYYKLKKDKLKLKKFQTSDVLAPIHDVKLSIKFSEAKDDILKMMKGFDEEIYLLGKEFFDKKRIHARPGDKKYIGAYCCNTKKSPYILYNFQSKHSNVFTLAHELGHGVHFMMSGKKQSFLQTSPSLLLAELASQFNELLMMDYYWNKLFNKKLKENILAHQLDDIFNVLFKQSMITQFEIDAHEASKNNTLTEDYLCELWMKLIKKRAGKSIEVQDEEKYSWMRISHLFISPFYCFNYTMSLFIVLALYNEYLSGDKKVFLKKYKALLSAGRSDIPENLLKKHFGFDINKDTFYKNGLEAVKSMIKKLQT